MEYDLRKITDADMNLLMEKIRNSFEYDLEYPDSFSDCINALIRSLNTVILINMVLDDKIEITGYSGDRFGWRSK